MAIEAVLFDLDGTLLDTALDFETAINRVLEEEGQPLLPTEGIRAYVTNGSIGVVTAAFDIDTSHADFSRLQARLLFHYRNCLTERTRVFPGLESSLNMLADRSVPWGIVTNKPSEYADPIVEKILPQSAVLVCPDHVEIAKPDPAGILLACEKMSVAPSNCIYVGDHLRDIEAGRAAGTTTVAVGWGYVQERHHHREWNADIVVDEPHELAERLRIRIDDALS